MSAIHQLVAGFSRGDAITNEAWALRRLFRSWGCPSEIYCEQRRITPELRRDARAAHELPAALTPRDIVLLHFSIGSPVNELFRQLRCRRVVRYHNITPPELVVGLHPRLARWLTYGREQLARLSETAEVVLAVSAFNAADLVRLGFSGVRVLPLVLELERLRALDGGRLKSLKDGRLNVLFVGRGISNKRLDDLLHCFHCLQRRVEPASRLVHVGSYAGTEHYHALLVSMARRLGLQEIHLTGTLSQRELNACYRAAHVFVSMSEHEGFGIPLIESMAHDVPVLAYAAAAVPETLDGAGVLFHRKEYDLVAEMAARLARPGALRDGVLAGQRLRLARYRNRDLGEELRALLAPLME